jgi:hypothetical protein
MCRTYNEVVEQDPIVKQIDDHIDENSLEPTEKLLLRVSRETYIKQTISEEKQEDKDRYPSLLWLAMKKPMVFFPGILAIFLLSSSFFVEETRIYLFELADLPPVQPEQYMAVAFPLFGFLVITSIVGARK